MGVEIVAKDVAQGSPEWHALRRQGIGGSDAPIIAGLSPWKSRYELWLEKVSEQPPEEDGGGREYLRWGHLLEPAIASEFSVREGHEVHELPAVLRSGEHPFMLANVDRLVGPPNALLGGLEIKTTRHGDDWAIDGDKVTVPMRVQAQGLHYMVVTGYRTWWFAVLIGGQELRIAEMAFTETMAENLVAIEADFWSLVERNIAPDIDGSDSTRRALARQWKAKQGTAKVVTGPVDFLLEQRVEMRRQMAELKEVVDEIDNELCAMLGDAERATDAEGHELYTWKAATRRSIDTTALKAAHPAIAEEFTKSTDYRTLRVKKEQP
jgi:putative phage-type endonuclease